MVTGYEHQYYGDITQIRIILQRMLTVLEKIEKGLPKWFSFPISSNEMIVNQEPLFRFELNETELKGITKGRKCKAFSIIYDGLPTNVHKAQADFMLKNFQREPRVIERMYKMITTLDNDKILFPDKNMLIELEKYVIALELCEKEADDYANLEGDEE